MRVYLCDWGQSDLLSLMGRHQQELTTRVRELSPALRNAKTNCGATQQLLVTQQPR